MKSMYQFMKSCLILFLLIGNVAAQNIFEAGKDYQITAPKNKSGPLVEEFFNYACGGCYLAENFINQFKNKHPEIRVKPVPMELRPAWRIYVKAYYIGEKLGVLDKSHAKLFHRIHIEKKPFRSEDDMRAFFLDIGVIGKDYDGVAHSYWLDTKMRTAKKYTMKNKIGGTPTFLVNGRYKLNNDQLGTYQRIEKAIVTLADIDKQNATFN
jgi:thiol:disulfide interchange protein DsbA